ncbi:beta-mannosidase [Pedobacter changchengzhani]|uniref:Mannan endo-1,4-beta-mannosidase n=2 Tax=Pedobacter changchengzhani TaxID=2529274 RepID=A0A4R5MNX7_9SPHI|nr:beta-mannosidase [Pedobacter changchengzhani]
MQMVFAQKMELSDKKATTETKNLYKNLQKLLNKGIMFGHQDDLAYGVNWKNPDGKRSDIKDVVNDYPAVFGWDLGHIEYGNAKNLDDVPFDKMKGYIKSVYDMGGINTIGWHVDNPNTLKNAWDNTKAINDVLPGGSKQVVYKKWMDNLAVFLKSLKGSDGKQIPVLFRPYHEMNGSWFWWGNKSATPEEYVKLYRYTVDYLKNKKHIHNLIYTYSPNTFQTAAEFMQHYPGDDVVDMIGFDNYQYASPTATDSVMQDSRIKFQAQIKNGLTILDSIAKAHKKIPTFAETGLEAVPDKAWWTKTLWPIIRDYKISYVLVWRNHGWKADENKFHYYGPYLGHPSAPDFQKFHDFKGTLFQSDLKKFNIYK